MLPDRIPRNASEMLQLLEKRLTRLELKGRGFSIPDLSTSGIATYSQDTEPTGTIAEGSIWIDTNASNAIYRYTSGVWVLGLNPNVDRVRDEVAMTIVAYQDDEARASDGFVTTYFRLTAPPGQLGDLWVNSSTNDLFRYNGSNWVSQGSTALGVSMRRAENLSSLGDQQVLTWWQFEPPVASGLGDLWVDTSSPTVMLLYRWTNFAWQQVTSWTGALFDLLATKISSWVQGTVPTSTAGGDIWIDTSNGNVVYVATNPGDNTISPSEWIQLPVGLGAIQPNAIDEENLLDDAVTFPKLRIGSFDNLVMNPGFEDTTVAPHVVTAGHTLTRTTANKRSGTYAGILTTGVEVTASTPLITFNGNPSTRIFHPNVQVGDLLAFSTYVRLEAVLGTTVLKATGSVYSQSGILLSTIDGDIAPITTTSGWTRVAIKLAITHADSSYAVFQLGADLLPISTIIYVDDVYGRVMLTGELLVDGSVTADQIAANTITANELAVGAVTATQLEADLILSSAITTGNLDEDESSPTFGELIGQRVEISPYGIRLVDEVGQDIVTLPVDIDQPARFNGQMTTSSLRAIGGTSIESNNNEIAASGSLMMANGVASPVEGPSLIIAYETIQLDSKTKIVDDLGNFAFNASEVVAFGYDMSLGGWIASQRRSNGSRIWRFTSTGSIYVTRDLPDWVVTGVTVRPGPSGTQSDWVGYWSDSWWLVGSRPLDTTDRYRNVLTRQNDSTWPTLGYDTSTNSYLVGETVPTDRVNIRRRQISPETGSSLISSATTVNLATGTGRDGSLTSIMYGPFDFGSNRYAWSARGSYTDAWVASTSGVANTSEYIPTAVTGAAGFSWDGANFWTLSTSGVLYRHTTWRDSRAKLFAGISYYDSDSSGTGTHETNLGSITGVTRRERAGIKATIPTVPDHGGVDDPDRWRLYTALATSTTPAAAAFHLQATGIGATPTTKSTLLLNSVSEVSATPSLTNTFPGSTPALFYSSANDSFGNPLISLRGDGSGRMGPFVWNAGDIDSGWVTLVASSTHTVSGNARCRKIGKLVEVEIYSIVAADDIAVTTTGNITDHIITNVPVGFRPPASIRGVGFVGRSASFLLDSSGNVYLTAADAYGTAWAIAAGNPIQCHFMYYIN